MLENDFWLGSVSTNSGNFLKDNSWRSFSLCMKDERFKGWKMAESLRDGECSEQENGWNLKFNITELKGNTLWKLSSLWYEALQKEAKWLKK